MAGSTTESIKGDSDDKEIYPKIHMPDLFYGDRKKFKAYCNQVRLYIWSDAKRTKKTLKNATEEVIWAASYLRGDAYARFEPYLEHYLEKGSCPQCEEPVRTIMAGLNNYLGLLKQSYGDLNETRTAELQLQDLTQGGTVPEYLTRFTQYASRVTWDTRAKMAQFYKGLNPRIKDAMALRPFPENWGALIDTASQLDDNFRRKAEEKRGQNHEHRFKQNQRKPRHPDEMEWTASTAVKRNPSGRFQKQGQKKKGKCYNCGKEGHFAAECRSAHKASSSEGPRKSPQKNKGKKGNQRKEKVHELRGKEKERDQSPDGAPIYFHLMRGRSQRTPSTSTLSDPPPPFRTTDDLPATAQITENRCTNPVHQEWEQVRAKLETDRKEYQQMNTNLVASLLELTQEVQAEMTERIIKLMKNFDEVSTMLTRVLTAKGLCVYCKARQPSTKEAATQTGITGEHEQLSWTACYDDQCRIHRSEKESAGWLPWGETTPRGESLKGKGRASYRKTRGPSFTRQQGRSTSPENDYYPENDHHFYIDNQPKGSHKFMTLDVNVDGGC